MTYYANIENNQINGTSELNNSKFCTENYFQIEVTEEIYNNIEKYIYSDGEIVINPNYEQEQAQARENLFKKDFFNIEGYGYFRKQPKGYTSAVESINTAFNIVTVVGILPKGSLIFYTKPDFTDETQCTEEWLIENQIKSEEMSATEFGKFYASFVTAWNTQEHLEE